MYFYVFTQLCEDRAICYDEDGSQEKKLSKDWLWFSYRGTSKRLGPVVRQPHE